MKDSSKVQKESRKQSGQGSTAGKGDSSKAANQSKSKEKGITIEELAPQPSVPKQKSKDTSQLKRDGKRKVGES